LPGVRIWDSDEYRTTGKLSVFCILFDRLQPKNTFIGLGKSYDLAALAFREIKSLVGCGYLPKSISAGA
jgi:hypothetical protein